MITAKEAAEKAENYLRNTLTTDLSNFERCITEEAEKGFKFCCVDGVISSGARKELELLGYEVMIGSQYNESYVIISW